MDLNFYRSDKQRAFWARNRLRFTDETAYVENPMKMDAILRRLTMKAKNAACKLNHKTITKVLAKPTEAQKVLYKLVLACTQRDAYGAGEADVSVYVKELWNAIAYISGIEPQS